MRPYQWSAFMRRIDRGLAQLALHLVRGDDLAVVAGHEVGLAHGLLELRPGFLPSVLAQVQPGQVGVRAGAGGWATGRLNEGTLGAFRIAGHFTGSLWILQVDEQVVVVCQGLQDL